MGPDHVMKRRLGKIRRRDGRLSQDDIDAAAAGRCLRLDLTAVDRVDSAGNYLLALLRRSGAQLIASGTAMNELVQSIARDWPLNK